MTRSWHFVGEYFAGTRQVKCGPGAYDWAAENVWLPWGCVIHAAGCRESATRAFFEVYYQGKPGALLLRRVTLDGSRIGGPLGND